MLLATSPVVLARHVPVALRGSSFGIKASSLYLGLIAGPVAGGWLASRFGWRAVFVMELPAAMATLALAAIYIPCNRPTHQRTRYDLAGACAWFLVMASFLWLLGHHRLRNLPGEWAAGAALPFLLLTLAASARRNPRPFFEARWFRSRTFSASVLSLVMAFTASYMLTFILPFLLVDAKHQGMSAVGWILAVYPLARSLVAWYSGRLSDRVDARLLSIPGLLLFVCGVAALSRLDESFPIPAVAGALLLAGLGFGCFVPPNNNTLIGSAPPELYGFAAGIMATSRTVGMMAGVALAGAILSSGGPLASRMNLVFRAAAALALAGAITSACATNEGIVLARYNGATIPNSAEL
jgi:MFS family permease